MGPVIHQTGDVVLGHFRELFLKNAFQAGKDDQAFALIVVIYDPEFDLSVALLDHCGLSNVRS